MSDAGDKYSKARQYWNNFENRVNTSVDTFLNAGAFEQKTFNRYMLKLSKRYKVDISETEIETTRGVLCENMKKDVKEKLDDIADNQNFISKFAELSELTENASDASEGVIRNTQNPRMDMEWYKVGETERTANALEDIAKMYEDDNLDNEEILVDDVKEIAELRDWINNEIERRSSEKRNAHSEGNTRRAVVVPRRRSSIGPLNTTLFSRRSIDPLQQ
ncbi:hypothetical protein PENTCL1PPCAC_23409 [Pristionchus entomophagus]|uniref:NAD(P)H-hydrate epimerase n=1 Tax=Pristionchus entomophagus TaxID=358040 RepID=A0AAV5U356_9BILA|nr:hypothetical protein PENTCL1PPCAC_23409 [Pristionchus entomophagus]